MNKTLPNFVGLSFGVNRLFLISMGIIIIMFLLISNFIMIIGIWKVNSTLKLSHKLYIFQCIIGLFHGFIMLPIYILTELFEIKVKYYMDIIIFFAICNQCILEMLTLAAIVSFEVLCNFMSTQYLS